MKPDDPAYWMLFDDHTTTPVPGLYRANCYICRDPEFAQMGMSLCYVCSKCKGHVPADDTICSDCGYENGPLDFDGEIVSSETTISDNALD